MLTKLDIKKKAGATIFSRGLDIQRSNKIKEFSVENADGYAYINAMVKGSGRNRYVVNATYDFVEDILESTYCDCPAYSSYNGICKHCVAILLEYVDHVDTQDRLLAIKKKKEESLAKLEIMKGFKSQKSLSQKPVVPSTTQGIKQLLSNLQVKKTLPMLQDITYGKVRLDPYMKVDMYGIQVEFKIGISHMYVLKDVISFRNSLLKNEHVSYGQKLQFTHTLEAFDMESRPLVQFINNWVIKYEKHHKPTPYYGYSYGYSQPKIRDLSLGSDDLGEFLDAIGDRTFTLNMNGSGEKGWRMTSEELPRKLEIKKQQDGIEVSINHLEGYQCINENVYFHDNKIYRVPHSKLEEVMDFLQCMAQIPSRKVYIQKEDIPAFCRELLPALEKFFDCTKNDFDETEYGIVPVRFEIYLDAPQKDFITCKVLATYGDKKYNVYDKQKEIYLRDLIKEIEVAKVVSSFCNAYDEKEKVMVIAQEEDKIYELLVNGIPKLQTLGEVFISDAMKRLNVTNSSKVVVGVSISGNLLELSMTSEDMSREQLLEILMKYNKKKKFYRLKNGDFVTVEGEDIEALLELKQGLNLTEKQLKQETIKIPKYRALYLDAELKERTSLSAMKDKGFKALVRNMKTVEDNDFDVPKSLDQVLREYQKRGFLWIKTLKYNGFGGILADDMGLGKTVQVIAFLLSEYAEAGVHENRKSLIVCPSSLVYNWKNELEKFAPSLPVKMIIGTTIERQSILQTIEETDILITSYDLLKRDIEHYENIIFHCQIIDEAQYIKNYNTQAAKSVKMIQADFKLALTGTPIENRLSELWSIFDYLMPGFLYNYQRFKEELEIPIVSNQDEYAVKRLHKLISPFVLRRLKREVLTDLPDKLEENVYAKLEGEQQKLYDAHVKRLQVMLDKTTEEEFKNSKIQILSEITKLRQICCDPALLYEDYNQGSTKMDMCMDLIQNAISGGHKILIFSQFTSLLERLQRLLEKEKISFYTLTGATSKENRARMVEQFNKDATSVFCISLKAGGTGLNLTSADIVIHFDPWWNLAVQNQATDRAHRIGQKNVVNVYKLIVKGTIEENIIKIQDKKKELADQILSGEGMNVGSFTREELMELLRG